MAAVYTYALVPTALCALSCLTEIAWGEKAIAVPLVVAALAFLPILLAAAWRERRLRTLPGEYAERLAKVKVGSFRATR